MVLAKRTYLEMRRPSDLRVARVPDQPVVITRQEPCAVHLYRFLYREVGGAYAWTDRAAWSDEDIAGHLAQAAIQVWVARVEGRIAGFFELRWCDDRSLEIAYFGLLPDFVGRGLGGHVLSEALREAWAQDPERVWLHTSTLDHAAALPNYLKRGMMVTRVEEYCAT
jgi:ribosomal protein S18 acetylase RimI-like enzyme